MNSLSVLVGQRNVTVRCLSGGVPVREELCDDWRKPRYPRTVPCRNSNDSGAACDVHVPIISSNLNLSLTAVSPINESSQNTVRRRQADGVSKAGGLSSGVPGHPMPSEDDATSLSHEGHLQEHDPMDV